MKGKYSIYFLIGICLSPFGTYSVSFWFLSPATYAIAFFFFLFFFFVKNFIGVVRSVAKHSTGKGQKQIQTLKQVLCTVQKFTHSIQKIKQAILMFTFYAKV